MATTEEKKPSNIVNICGNIIGEALVDQPYKQTMTAFCANLCYTGMGKVYVVWLAEAVAASLDIEGLNIEKIVTKLLSGVEVEAFDFAALGYPEIAVKLHKIVKDWMMEDDASVAILTTDGDTLAVVNEETGEVIGFADAPEASGDILNLITWVGDRRAAASARLTGIECEKAAYMDKISKQYDAKINRLRRIIAWMDKFYPSQFRQYASDALAGKKARSLKIGLLTLKFRTTKARVDVLDANKALGWLKEHKIFDAIVTKESVSKSGLPEAVKLQLVDEKLIEESGISFYPGGEEEFSIE